MRSTAFQLSNVDFRLSLGGLQSTIGNRQSTIRQILPHIASVIVIATALAVLASCRVAGPGRSGHAPHVGSAGDSPGAADPRAWLRLDQIEPAPDFAERFHGELRIGHLREAHQLLEYFDRVWEDSRSDPNLRRLDL